MGNVGLDLDMDRIGDAGAEELENDIVRRSRRPRLEPSLSSVSNMLFHLPRRAY